MTTAIIFAGGTGQRMSEVGIPKQFLLVRNKPIISYTLLNYQRAPEVTRIVIAVLDGWQEHAQKIADEFNITKLSHIVIGGKDNAASKLAALESLVGLAEPDEVIFFHDAVRPLWDDNLIPELILQSQVQGACVTVSSFEHTALHREGSGFDLIRREEILVAVAPQSARFDLALALHRQAVELPDERKRDLATILNEYQVNYGVIESKIHNLKVTKVEDVFVFKALLELQESSAIYGLLT